MKTFLIGYFLVLLSACVTQPTVHGYQEYCQTWVGLPENQLVLTWGAPAQTYNSGDEKFLTYIYDGGTVVAPIYSTAVMVHRACKTTFVIKDSKVINYSFGGNACVSDYKSPQEQLDEIEKRDKERLAACKKNAVSGGFNMPINCK